MNANGAPDVLSLDLNSDADHGACVQPAVTFAIFLFNSFQNLTSTATQELTGNADEPFLVVPNPVADELILQADDQMGLNAEVALYDVHGKLVRTSNWTGTNLLRMDVSDLNTGLYFLMIDSDSGRFSTKVLVE